MQNLRDVQAQQYQILQQEIQQLRARNQQLELELRSRGGVAGVVSGPRVPQQNVKISMPPFDGKEIYKNLGAGFVLLGRQFLVKVQMAEEQAGHQFTEMFKTTNASTTGG
ncbi:hypothetical protein ATCC90586_011714 [Pythium insidiosum]|nr:hypothetical protein ATCC90586_011714 [Pythium insidiosum]